MARAVLILLPVLSSTTMLDARQAVEFCRSDPNAVVATVWPTARSEANAARGALLASGARLVHERTVAVARRGAVPACMALYHGEDWIHTNCWYDESPLPEGPPEGPFAGAKWKAALAWQQDAPLTVFVLDAQGARGSLWRDKYGIRESLRQAVGGLGNACLHLTDDQSEALEAARSGGRGARGGGGYACDSSFANHCARVLLDETSVAFLNAADVASPQFAARFEEYTAWLESTRDGGDCGGAPVWPS